MDGKRPEQFLIETDKDVSLFGWETKTKFHSYYMDISPWNLSDLFKNKDKLGLDIVYDDNILPIVENLRTELKIYQDAKAMRLLPADDINDLWEEMGFPYLFPKIEADLHQKRVTLWSLKVKRGGAYLEQGTGKTPVGIFILGYLLANNLVQKPLVFAPLSLLGKSAWFGDLERFTEFKPVNLRDPEAPSSHGQISFVNLDKLQHWCWIKTKNAEHSYDKDNYFELMKFDACYYDESSTLRGHSSYRTRAFIKISRHMKYLIEASGAPAPNNVFQFWGQMKAIGSVLGDSYTAFEQRYGVQRSVGPVMRWFPRYNAEQEIRKRIDLVSYFIKRDDVLDLPKRNFISVDVDLHPDHMKLYNKIEEDYISAVQGLDENGDIIDGKLRVEHEIAVRIRLMQIMDGFTTIEDKDGKKHLVTLPWNAKLDVLDKRINDHLSASASNNIIIWTIFRTETEFIYEKYKDIATFIYGGMSDKERDKNLDRWLNDPTCRIIVAIPKAAKYGHTWLKANKTIYYSATEDFDDYVQSHDRNYRRGQDREVDEEKLVTNKTIERKIWTALMARKKLDKFLKDYYLEKASPRPDPVYR
jgi:SNF2 family DNA or RNA helicase